MLHEIPDCGGELLPHDGGDGGRGQEVLWLHLAGVGRVDGGAAVGVGDAVDLAARVKDVVHRQLQLCAEIPATKTEFKTQEISQVSAVKNSKSLCTSE